MAEYTKAQLTEMIVGKLRRNFGRDVDDATPNHMFKACALVLRDIMSSHQMETGNQVWAESDGKHSAGRAEYLRNGKCSSIFTKRHC